ncbi:MAG TPA: hypothetical protein VF960_04270 [Chloroflexota bacterium]
MAFRIAAYVLILLAVAGGVLGYLSLGAIADISELPIGPVLVGLGAIMAVFARMAQAEYHNTQQIERLKAIHYMIRDEIDRAALVPSRGRDFAVAEEEEVGSE